MTRSHEMSFNLKFGNLRYLHVSNLQVLLVILILKSHLYSKRFGRDVLLNVACVAEAIWRKSTLKLSSFSLATGLNVPVFTTFGTGTYQTLGHLKRLEISTLANF